MIKKEQIQEEYTIFKRYVKHLQATRLQDEGKAKVNIMIQVNRNLAYEIDIKVKKNRDSLPLKTNYYKSIPQNIRLQEPTPVLLERISTIQLMKAPLAITNVDDIDDHIRILEQGLAKSIEESKHNLRIEHKLFLDLFLDKFKISSIQQVFQLQELARFLKVQIDQLQQYYLGKLLNNYTKPEFLVKYQFIRFNRYFCPICNMYLCSVHYHSKNQRLYIEREPEENQQLQDPTQHDNYYETEFRPNSQVLKELTSKYRLNNKMELEIRCRDTQKCGRFVSDQNKMKKFQQKCIENMLEFGFTNCCFMAKILQHPYFNISCSQISYIVKNWKFKPAIKKKPQKQRQIYSSYIQQYIPCFHDGDCGGGDCSCVQCYRYCCCKGKCLKQVQTCDCKNCGYDDKKQKFTCPCYSISQECDPAICKCQTCNNKNLLMQIRRRLVLGKSLICNGLGLFAGEHFRQFDYVGEYIGSYLLLDEESSIVEQCDWITNNHYLFEIDDVWQVDGTYYSNVLRFINHATKKSDLANCQATVLFSEGRWRIAMVATKEIKIGEELFFDYGDKFKTKWLTQFNELSDQYFKK